MMIAAECSIRNTIERAAPEILEAPDAIVVRAARLADGRIDLSPVAEANRKIGRLALAGATTMMTLSEIF